MTTAFRLLKRKYASTAFSGKGARLYGGRWNHVGVPVIYCSESLALAALEVLVHLGRTNTGIRFVSIEVTIPDDIIEDVDQSTLPSDWRREPPGNATKGIGSDWVRDQRSAVLRVPSAIIPPEADFVLNPSHPDFSKVGVGVPTEFTLDPRLWA